MFQDPRWPLAADGSAHKSMHLPPSSFKKFLNISVVPTKCKSNH